MEAHIDILIPVLARPHNVQPLLDSAAAATATPHRVLFIATAGDRPEIAALEKAGAEYLIHPEKAGPGNYGKKINYGFTHTTGNYFLNGSDDIQFDIGWDFQALRRMKGQIGVVATNDMANRQVMRGEFGTHCLISRDYINRFGGTGDNEPGVVLYEGYDHNYVDRELCDVARRRGRYAFAHNAVVRHRHPHWKTAAWDATYHKGLKHFREDQLLYGSRTVLWSSRNRDIVAR